MITLLCEHCFGEITGRWMSDIPKPGQTNGQVPYWHLDRKECREAGTSTQSQRRGA